MQRPERSLAGFIGRTWHLNEAIVKTEGMPNGVLPTLLVLPVKREQIHDELVDLRQCQHLVGCVLYRHGDQTDVRIRWFRMGITTPIGFVATGPLESGIW